MWLNVTWCELCSKTTDLLWIIVLVWHFFPDSRLFLFYYNKIILIGFFLFFLKSVTWRSSFGPVLPNWSHPTTTEPPVNISVPTEEKTEWATTKNCREPRITYRIPFFHNTPLVHPKTEEVICTEVIGCIRVGHWSPRCINNRWRHCVRTTRNIPRKNCWVCHRRTRPRVSCSHSRWGSQNTVGTGWTTCVWLVWAM